MEAQARQQMEQAHQLIKQHRYDKAYDLLVGLDNPTAVQWRQKLQTLINAGAFDDPFDEVVPRKRKRASHSPELSEAVALFIHNNWEMVNQINDTAIVQKKRTPNKWGAAALIVCFSLLGMFIVLLAIATAKEEKVTLRQTDDGSIRVMWKKGAYEANNITTLQAIANSVKDGATTGATVALGIGSFLFWFIIF